jgi:hypothetical protein
MAGRAPSGQALVASDGAQEVSTLSGFDPSRGGIRREEAVALLPFFTNKWEPLRDVLRRAGEHRSASQMVSRARELEASGAVESRWERAMKVWRKTASETQDGWLARISAEQNRLRLLWLANAVLACDYGDNDAGQVGWRVRADARSGEPLMFGPSINAAIDNAMAAELIGAAPNGGDAQ